MVFHSYNLNERYEGLVAKYPTEIVDKKQLQKLCKLLLKSHTPDNRNILEKYSLELSDLTTGVQCPACQKFSMIRKRTWICPHCQHSDSNAHEKALKDYFLLVKPETKNREFRDFMHISNVYASSKMLTRLNLPFTGENKGRIYSGEEYIYEK